MSGREYESKIMQNETIEGTVAFFDICGFTSISETAQANTVVTLINSYFDLMAKEIMSHDGLIDKFIGDAIMAVFKGPHHLDRAIDAAIAVRDQLSQLTTTEEAPQFLPKVSIGIKSGEMISGNIGSASLKRLDFTVIGDTVNTAARLQDAAGENQIIISDACYDQVKESFKCESLGSIELKNKTKPIHIYNVIE
jgi:class 3 adenylate cyclase